MWNYVQIDGVFLQNIDHACKSNSYPTVKWLSLAQKRKMTHLRKLARFVKTGNFKIFELFSSIIRFIQGFRFDFVFVGLKISRAIKKNLVMLLCGVCFAFLQTLGKIHFLFLARFFSSKTFLKR